MRMVIQRVKEAEVKVESKVVGQIKKGALVFFAVHKEDTAQKILWLVQKLIHLRIFPDKDKKMNLSLQDVEGEVLVVSQFTLYGSCLEGRRPDFTETAPPQVAKPLYEEFVEALKKDIKHVETGVFGAEMEVTLVNDGPVTFIIDK